jgi:hypothetical protein
VRATLAQLHLTKSFQTTPTAQPTQHENESRAKTAMAPTDINSCDFTSSGNDITIHLDLDIEVDIVEDLETLARLNRLGRFKEAIALFKEKLQEHLDFFPVVAEYADLLLEQGSFGRLSEFLSGRLDEQADPSGDSLDADEVLLLKTLKSLAEIYSKGALKPALGAAASVLEYLEEQSQRNRFWFENPSGIQVRGATKALSCSHISSDTTD